MYLKHFSGCGRANILVWYKYGTFVFVCLFHSVLFCLTYTCFSDWWKVNMGISSKTPVCTDVLKEHFLFYNSEAFQTETM